MADKPNLVLEDCFTSSSSISNNNDVGDMNNLIKLNTAPKKQVKLKKSKKNTKNKCLITNTDQQEDTNLSDKNENTKDLCYSHLDSHVESNSSNCQHEHIFNNLLHVDYNHGNTHYNYSHCTDKKSKYIKNKHRHHHHHHHHKYGHGHHHHHHKHGHHHHNYNKSNSQKYGYMYTSGKCSNIDGVVFIKIHKMLAHLTNIKIITIQACSSLRSEFHQKYIILKLKNIFNLVEELNTYIYEKLESTIDEEILKSIELNYEEILDKPFNFNNYLEILRIVDRCIYHLKKILKNI